MLQIPIMGFLPADDPRMVSTIRVIQNELSTPEGFVWRNEMHGARGSEGTFVACTFWIVENLALIGDLDGRAAPLRPYVTSCANDLGLFAEEIEAAYARAPWQLPPGLQPPRPHPRGRAPAAPRRAPSPS